jgi:hypothetical protein
LATDVKSGGSFLLGLNSALTETRLEHNFTTHEVDDLGVSLGLILPITDRRYFLSYKGAVAFHGVTDVIHGSSPSPDDDRFYRNLDQYIGSLNGIVIGTRFDVSRSLYVEPMFGLGVLVHIIYGNRGEGIAYGSYQADLTALAMYKFERVDLGAWLTLGYVPFSGYLERADFKYLSIGLALSI